MILSILVYFAGALLFLFTVLCLACGLFYLAEWIEENTIKTRKVFGYMIYVQMGGLVLACLIDRLPFFRISFSILVHYFYVILLREFPISDFSNPMLILSAGKFL
jgi:hypothetical protein